MKQEFPQSSSPIVPVLALLGACVLAAVLFLLVPLTQATEAEPVEPMLVRPSSVAPPPPPPTPPLPEETEPEEMLIQPKPPVLEQEVQDVETTQLELSLAPGMGVPLKMGVPNMPAVQTVDTVAEIKKLLTFDDLDQKPRVLNGAQQTIRLPRLRARRVKRVDLLVRVNVFKSGKGEFVEIVSSSHDHPEVEREVRRLIRAFRWTIPRRNGKPIDDFVEGKMPLELQP